MKRISGKKIRERRTQLRIKKNKFAKLIGVSTNTIYNWESGGKQPSDDKLPLILKALECDINDISHGEGEPFPKPHDRTPEVYVPSESSETVQDTPLKYRSISAPHTVDTGEIPIAEDVAAAIKVLSSGTPYATALHLNICAFANAIADRARIYQVEQGQAEMASRNRDFDKIIQEMRDQIQDLQEKVVGLNREVAVLKEENAILKKENAVLKGKLNNLGGDPPGTSGEDTGESKLEEAM